jgi:hypothetical protein
MTKTDTALRYELEELKNSYYQVFGELCDLKDELSIERKRIDRIVQVLLNNLPESSLNKKIDFSGSDCHGNFHGLFDDDVQTLRDFLQIVIEK